MMNFHIETKLQHSKTSKLNTSIPLMLPIGRVSTLPKSSTYLLFVLNFWNVRYNSHFACRSLAQQYLIMQKIEKCHILMQYIYISMEYFGTNWQYRLNREIQS